MAASFAKLPELPLRTGNSTTVGGQARVVAVLRS